MTNTSFLNKIAKLLMDDYSDQLSDTVIILPNKRAKVFLLEAIKNQLSQTVLAPEIISIEDFVQHIAGIRSVDAIEQLFELPQPLNNNHLNCLPIGPKLFYKILMKLIGTY
jgi:hypothetical protein